MISFVEQTHLLVREEENLNRSGKRSFILDRALSPSEKYHFILRERPQLVKSFPAKLQATYLKMAPETLSRVRANF